ncbi:MAG: acylphosphatase [Rubripirellula sp.]|nr:acylphosphatase [Rubripirellula sp.]
MDSDTNVRYHVRFIGRVQGVGFRMTCISLAENLPVHGTVRNEHDGSVLLDVEGDPVEVGRLLKRIEREMVDNIRKTEIDERPPSKQTGGLRIRY